MCIRDRYQRRVRGCSPAAMRTLVLLGLLAIARGSWQETTPLVDTSLEALLQESQEFADASPDDRSGEGTEIQRALRGYAGGFLAHLDMLQGDTMSMSGLTTTFEQYLKEPRKLTGELAQIREKIPTDQLSTYEQLAATLNTNRLARHIVDKLPHDGDKLLMNDHSSCGGQSIDDLFADLYEQHPQPEKEFAASQPEAHELEESAEEVFQKKSAVAPTELEQDVWPSPSW
eukprot:TRINITY_DN1449_c0_g1_i2.p1 TRINITY_DN1449_c0_g1~~TRINITY_DN1449_c0_g1_i2.p1  ORF type:complete len:230 (-),score=76.47 TRINITY_DN1449_c0_g1_i2:172-861(-)